MAKYGERQKVLELLIDQGVERWTIRKLAQARKINYKSAYTIVHELSRDGVIALETLGNSTLCSFNHRLSPLVFDVECHRRTTLFKDSRIKSIYERLQRLPTFFIVLVFGSHVKGTATKHSDIDLLIIAEDEKPVQQALRLLPLEIHTTGVTPQEFISMTKSKEFSVVSEVLKKNAILIGIEDYYRLLEHAI